MTKYIFVTGGVVSGLGKGISAASIGRLLKARGYKVTAQKLDPYINVDPGTMSPFQHGEVFVTEDGLEADLDLGHYERFIDENLHTYSNLTTGKVYWNVLNKEREGKYLGQTVQVIPHITDEIKNFILAAGRHTNADVVITEIGGTIGDIESQPFLESIRQAALQEGRENCLFAHVTYIPYLDGSKEYKSKPTQHSVKELQSYGIHPDLIIARCDEHIPQSVLDKISLFCNVSPDSVLENRTLDSLYEVPLMLEEQHTAEIICSKLHLEGWKDMVNHIHHADKPVTIALVGKYVALHDAYLSVAEALQHGSFENEARLTIKWVDSEHLENPEEIFRDVDGIILPGGFGGRGVEGMIETADYARRNNVPYLGICLDMQIAAISFARNVLGYEDANSFEFDENSSHLIIDFMANQNNEISKGGTMRLGAYPCYIRDNTLLFDLYNRNRVEERHRHRYEFNNAYRQEFADHGMTIAGTSPDNSLVEAIDLADHPFYIGVQYHPEFKSRPNRAHPLFSGLIRASLANREKRLAAESALEEEILIVE